MVEGDHGFTSSFIRGVKEMLRKSRGEYASAMGYDFQMYRISKDGKVTIADQIIKGRDGKGRSRKKG